MVNNKPVSLSFLYFIVKAFACGLGITILLSGIVLLLSSLAQAKQLDEGAPVRYKSQYDVQRGTLLFKGENDLISAPILSTEVKINVIGMIARANIRQHFRNPDQSWKEGVYVFPLPEHAAVDRMRMHIGERIIEGQIKEREQAKKIYNKAKKAGKKTGLVEQERPNIFSTSVANIGPHEEIIIEIEYQQIVSYDSGYFQLRFPMVVAPRYIPGNTTVKGFSGSGWALNTDRVRDAARVTPNVAHPDKAKINPVAITVDLNTGFEFERVDSPYHGIRIENLSKTHYRVTLEDQTIPTDRDFVLNWKPLPSDTPKAAFFRETFNGSDYGLLMVMPPHPFQGKVMNREVIFVVDTSGSMSGTSILQAKNALKLAVNRLKAGDRFNIIQFNDDTSQLFPASQEVRPKTLQRAYAYINSLQADGGTEMAPAIYAALSNTGSQLSSFVSKAMQTAGVQVNSAKTDLRQVIFLTDGSVGNEQELFEIIKRNLADSRLFTIGIGSAPNSHFMNSAARFGRGTHTYIGNVDEVQAKMGKLLGKLEKPVLSDIAVHWPAGIHVESWPEKIPDLYSGEPLLISSKSTSLPEQVEVDGRIGNETWSKNISLMGGQVKSGVAVLWARRKIQSLMDQASNSSEFEMIKKMIISTALAHHVVSKYTSLVAVDITPARKRAELLKRAALQTNLPAGWKYKKVFGTLPRTATPANQFLLLGLFILILGLVIYKLVNFRNSHLQQSRAA